MSLFIGSLAFEDASNQMFDERLGIILGSLASGIFGYIVLTKSLSKTSREKLEKKEAAAQAGGH
jgi:NhaA family Na+:H+ antiporter